MMSKKCQADAAVAARTSMNKPNWRATALAVATAALLSGVSMDANALALGRVTVQSALGEPLRAEVDIAEATADELSSLKVNIAGPDAFRAAGLEYSSALSGAEVTLQKRPNGHPYLLLTNSRPVNDPFIDLVLETQWSSGRVVRDYTMLFDPPQMRQGSATAAAPLAPLAPLTPSAPPATQAARTSPVRPQAAAPARPTAPVTRAPETAEAPAGGDKVTVQRGDSAGRIAAMHKPPTVSLDQMLVALLQANPQAFVGGNVNRLKAGAVLQLPSEAEVAQTPAAEATRTIVAQSRDFNEFRRRLAEGVGTSPVAGSERQASGKVQTEVQEKTPAPASPDKLTLSKGAVQGKGAADKIARERQAQDTASRLAELNKNIADLSKLQSATGTPAAGAASGGNGKAPAGPAVAAPPLAPTAKPGTASAAASAAQPVAAAATAPKPGAAASVATTALASASSPAAAASAPVAIAPASGPAAVIAARPASAPAAKPAGAIAKKPAVAALPVEEPSLLDDLLDNPMMLAAGGALVALLAGFGVYRLRQRKKSPQVDSSFLESRLQPDSFFGGSGGQRIDTAEGGATGSSMVYSPSQLDAAGDVDPVAEADVYLAYGRDLQAEEILKEALRVSPHRVAIHSKLLEIYAKRRDAKAFEVTATDAYGLTHGEGIEWEHISELGRELDPANPLYQPGGAPSGGPAAAAGVAAAAAAARAHELEAPATTSPDVDLDLDFSSGEESGGPVSAQSTAAHLHEPPADDLHHVDLDLHDQPQAAPPQIDLPVTPTVQPPAAAAPAQSLDEPLSFELPPMDEIPPAAAAHAAPPTAAPAADDEALSFDLEPEPGAAAAPAAAAPVASAPAPADDKMMEFDLGSLSLDLDSSTPAKPPTVAATANAPAPAAGDEAASTQGLEEGSSDPLATKFALAQEFNAIGDPDGARSLAEEVLAEASGDLKTRAQKFLAEIG
jgi:pilus assembly protein FimV